MSGDGRMKFTTKNVFIGTYVFNFIIIYIVSLMDNAQSIVEFE